MIDSRSKLDERQDHRDLLNLRVEFRKKHDDLLKAWKENKVLQSFKEKYEPEMEKLRENRQKLSEVAA